MDYGSHGGRNGNHTFSSVSSVPSGKKIPGYVEYLGRVLPYSTMGLLVVYCLKGVTPFAWPFGVPEFTASAAVVVLHVWKRNSLLSIGAGTFLYMFLIQTVFS